MKFEPLGVHPNTILFLVSEEFQEPQWPSEKAGLLSSPDQCQHSFSNWPVFLLGDCPTPPTWCLPAHAALGSHFYCLLVYPSPTSLWQHGQMRTHSLAPFYFLMPKLAYDIVIFFLIPLFIPDMYLFIYFFEQQICVIFQHQFSNSLTPAGCPTIQFWHSVWSEHQNSQVAGSSHKTVPPLDTSTRRPTRLPGQTTDLGVLTAFAPHRVW